LGYQLSQNPLDYSLKNSGWSDFIPGGNSPYSWPNIGFRAPLLPYSLSIFYLLKLDFLVLFFIPIIGTISIFLIYILAKKMFNEKIGLYSAFLFSIIPLHVVNSGFILTGVYETFWILLGCISFWKAYEENNFKYSIFCGIFLALGILSRYTVLWILPIFPIYLIITKKFTNNLKKIGATLTSFFIVLIPLFIYGYMTYGNIFGAFLYGFYASTYWGGTQNEFFYFKYWVEMFSVIGIIALGGVYFFVKEVRQRKNIFILLFFFLFLGASFLTGHKEQRFILPLVIPICILSAIFIYKVDKRKILLIFTMILVLISLFNQGLFLYKNSYDGTNYCLKESIKFLDKIDGDIKIINDETTILFYYLKQETMFLPSRNPEELKNLMNEKTYLLYTDINMPLFIEENEKTLEEWNKNFEKVFECDYDWGLSRIYKKKLV
jgi:asparagine N-glycosylation enzyme membrane subunit Stt3